MTSAVPCGVRARIAHPVTGEALRGGAPRTIGAGYPGCDTTPLCGAVTEDFILRFLVGASKILYSNANFYMRQGNSPPKFLAL